MMQPEQPPWPHQDPAPRQRQHVVPDRLSEKTLLTMLGLILGALLVICGIVAWFLAELIPG